MPSPFPGMNPYFEQPGVWRGFHNHLVSQIALALGLRVGPRHYAELEVREYLDFDTVELASVDPPTAVLGDSPNGPVIGRLPRPLTRKHRWLTIRDTQSREVVTVLEVLSPSNKSGGDRGQYLRERLRILRSAAHLVEIDLLRGGDPMPSDGAPESDYRVLVSRRPDRPDVQVWPVGVREPLPVIPVPLRTGEPDVTLELKPLIDVVYDSVYRHRLYTSPPDPPLSPADAAWARQFVSAG